MGQREGCHSIQLGCLRYIASDKLSALDNFSECGSIVERDSVGVNLKPFHCTDVIVSFGQQRLSERLFDSGVDQVVTSVAYGKCSVEHWILFKETSVDRFSW